jgi:hypothetical protein
MLAGIAAFVMAYWLWGERREKMYLGAGRGQLWFMIHNMEVHGVHGPIDFYLKFLPAKQIEEFDFYLKFLPAKSRSSISI